MTCKEVVEQSQIAPDDLAVALDDARCDLQGDGGQKLAAERVTNTTSDAQE